MWSFCILMFCSCGLSFLKQALDFLNHRAVEVFSQYLRNVLFFTKRIRMLILVATSTVQTTISI